MSSKSMFMFLIHAHMVLYLAAQQVNSVEDKSAKAKCSNCSEINSTLTVTYSWVNIPNNVIAGFNESIYVDCEVKSDSDDSIEYEWTGKDGKAVPAGNTTSGENMFMYSNGTLVIRQFSDEYSNDYTCSSGADLAKTISIRAGRAAVLGSLSESFQTFTGCNVTVHCRARGDGQIDGTWHYGEENAEIPADGDKLVTAKSVNNTFHVVLHITEATVNDSGVYSCKAFNDYGPSTSKSIEIEISERPENQSCPASKIIASLPQLLGEYGEGDKVARAEKNIVLVYIVPAVIVGCLLLIAIVIAVTLIVRKRRQQQNAIFSGVKYRRTEGNEETIRT